MAKGVKDALKFLGKDAGGMALGGGLIMMNSEMSKTAKLWELIKLKALPISASIAGSIFGITTAIKAAIKNSGILEESFKKLDRIKFATTQFDALYKNLEKAKQQVASIIQLTSSGVFNFEDVKEGTRALAILSNRVLDTHKNLERVGDAAAGTGVSFYDMGTAVGAAYRAMAEGGADAGLNKLQALGAVSEESAVKVRNMAAAGASLTQMWAVVETDLDSMNGKMQEVGDTTEVLTSKYEQARTKMATAFGQHFMEEERETLKATTEVTQNLIPIMNELGKTIGAVTGFADKWTEQLKAWVTSFEFLTPVIDTVAKSMMALAAIIAGFGIANLISSVAQTGMSLLQLVKVLGTTEASLALYSAANAAALAGNTATATSLNVLAWANEVLVGAIRNCIKWIVAQTAALLANPWVLAVLAVSAMIGVMVKLIQTQDESNKLWDETRQKHREVETAISNTANAMKNLDDQVKATKDVMEALATAWTELHALEQSGAKGSLIAAKQHHIVELLSRKKKIEEATGLGPGVMERELMTKRAEEERKLGETEFQNQMANAPEAVRRQMTARKLMELQAKDAEKLTMEDEDVRLSRWDQQHPTASPEARAQMRRDSASRVIQETQAAQDLTAGGYLEAGGAAEVAAADLRKQIAAADPTRTAALEAEYKQMKITAARTKIELDAEQKLADIWAEGLSLAQQESDVRLTMMNQQIALAFKLGDIEEQARLEAARDREVREQVKRKEQADREIESIASGVTVAQMRTDAADLALRGDFGGAGSLANQARDEEEAQAFRERVQSLKSTTGSEAEARTIATAEQDAARRAREVKTDIFRRENARETEIINLEGTKGEGKRAALQKAVVMRDMDRRRELLQEGLTEGLRGEELEQFATGRIMAEIQKRGQEPQAIATSLAAIGGGGDVGVVNPLLTVAQEQKAVLDIIAKNTTPPDRQPDSTVVFQ